MKPILVVLSGAGMSAESGISTFRDSNGLWENHDVKDVASPEGFRKNPTLVLEFYNQRRRQLLDVKPNAGHLALKELEKDYEVYIITQNVDDLHERAGSTNIVHLHGELKKVRSTKNERLVYDWLGDLVMGDLSKDDGAQLRPHIVWFGEMVPELEKAARIVAKANVVMIIGTSMQVYPAAGLVDYASSSAKVFYIDPNPAKVSRKNLIVIDEKATTGVRKAMLQLD
jgi:NAD-dependent deacetylase